MPKPIMLSDQWHAGLSRLAAALMTRQKKGDKRVTLLQLAESALVAMYGPPETAERFAALGCRPDQADLPADQAFEQVINLMFADLPTAEKLERARGLVGFVAHLPEGPLAGSPPLALGKLAEFAIQHRAECPPESLADLVDAFEWDKRCGG